MQRNNNEFVENLMTGAVIAGALYGAYKVSSNLGTWFTTSNGKQIEIVETVRDCEIMVNILKRYQVLGFDCEWVNWGQARPIALIQLATKDGLCVLFRLCRLSGIPKGLRELLDDENVIKVGVDPQGDARKISNDYGVNVSSTLDLRFMAVMTNRIPQSLAKMALDICGLKLDKDWGLPCSDWEAEELDQRQINYAANDAFAAIEIFKELSKKISITFEGVIAQITPYLDKSFV